MTPLTSEIIGLAIGAVLTLVIFSYLVGDNALYRLALHLFVGALVGYSFGVLVRDILVGLLWTRLLAEPLSVVVPLVLGILLLFKGFPKQAYIGNFSVAYLVGVGTAVALGGALLGTFIPQIRATTSALQGASYTSFPLGLVDGLLIVVGTAGTLLTFSFTTRKQARTPGTQNQIARIVGWIVRIPLVVALGVAFAGAVTASLSILIGRIQYIIDAVMSFLKAGS